MKLRLFLYLVLLLVIGVVRAEVPRTVVTIKPIHSLVAYVMGNRGEPILLLKGFASPHAFQLRPAQAVELQKADIVVWVGPQIETFMPRLLATFDNERVLTLSAIDGLRRLPNRAAGVWEQHSHVEVEQTDHDESSHEIDGHYWLDPTNAQLMTTAIARRLSQLDRHNAIYYQSRAKQLNRELQQLDSVVREQLAPYKRLPFIVLHDAFHYFESRYELHPIGSITTAPDVMPSAKRITALRDAIETHGVRCVFIESGVESALSRILAESPDVHLGELAPLGAALQAGPNHYRDMMLHNASALVECLRR